MKSHYKHDEEKESIRKLNSLQTLKESYLAGLGSGTGFPSIKDKGHIFNQDTTGLVINHLNQTSDYASKENTHKFVQEVKEFENRIKPLYPEKLEETDKLALSELVQKHGTKKEMEYFKQLTSLNEGTGKDNAGSYDSAFAWREDEPALDHEDMFDEDVELDEDLELDECGEMDYEDSEMVMDAEPQDDIEIVLSVEPEEENYMDLSSGEFKLGNIFSV